MLKICIYSVFVYDQLRNHPRAVTLLWSTYATFNCRLIVCEKGIGESGWAGSIRVGA